jgi:peptide/nickel transport system substrate-binding protein
MKKILIVLMAVALFSPSLFAAGKKEAEVMTEFDTKRSETVIVQTFDARSAVPDAFNMYIQTQDRWHGSRMLAFAYLWETDTGTGETAPELAAGPPEVLNDSYTKFRVKLRSGIYWSDGVEFTADDIIYTCEATRRDIEGLPRARRLDQSYNTVTKIDKYTFEVETKETDYYFEQNWGVWTWGARMLWVIPKHIYEKHPDISKFKDPDPVTLGAYVLDKFDPNGYWHVWRLRDDWERSAWQVYTKKKPAVKYVVYQNVGPEEKQVLAFHQNKLDAATFMTWESIKAVQQKNPEVRTFSPKFPLFWMDDACAFGIIMNAQKEPFNNKNVRWALALSLDLKSATMSALGGAFRVSAIPMVDQPWMKATYFDPLIPWLENYTLETGFKPFNRKYADEMKKVLQSQGIADLPRDGEETYTLMGTGWWKHDLGEAEKLMLKAGMKRGADNKWKLADGSNWQPILYFPGDWHAILQRMGFAIVDGWKKFGIDVIAKQVDSGEYRRAQDYNNILEMRLGWPQCSYISPVQFMDDMRREHLMPADSATPIVSNHTRWDNIEADKLIGKMLETPPDDPSVVDMQLEVLKMLIDDMALINLASIPTTIPENWAYWKGWPTSDNYYATPLTWWSCFKHVIMNLEPTGKK